MYIYTHACKTLGYAYHLYRTPGIKYGKIVVRTVIKNITSLFITYNLWKYTNLLIAVTKKMQCVLHIIYIFICICIYIYIHTHIHTNTGARTHMYIRAGLGLPFISYNLGKYTKLLMAVSSSSHDSPIIQCHASSSSLRIVTIQ